MVIWPKMVSLEDPGWKQAAGAMQVLPLDPRNINAGTGKFYESADDLLSRPMIYQERKRVQANYYQYTLRFGVSFSVHGAILLDSVDELNEFRRTVGLALESRLTRIERAYWEARHKVTVTQGGRGIISHVMLREAPQELAPMSSLAWYEAARHEVVAKNRATTGCRGMNVHDQTLELLIEMGQEILDGTRAPEPICNSVAA